MGKDEVKLSLFAENIIGTQKILRNLGIDPLFS